MSTDATVADPLMMTPQQMLAHATGEDRHALARLDATARVLAGEHELRAGRAVMTAQTIPDHSVTTFHTIDGCGNLGVAPTRRRRPDLPAKANECRDCLATRYGRAVPDAPFRQRFETIAVASVKSTAGNLACLPTGEATAGPTDSRCHREHDYRAKAVAANPPWAIRWCPDCALDWWCESLGDGQ
ncbi:hypothetical protein [Halomarina oriensis]|uniref:Uncharacterized protein n=1 Tax=Halomarina oriensis TaxID=671145 RepID=A0A6B0GP00_9EURY|nr:hypothetical protein [Halomarina oriensis]MWG36524.1 hypothetical protein [Halomarina oriensis]